MTYTAPLPRIICTNEEEDKSWDDELTQYIRNEHIEYIDKGCQINDNLENFARVKVEDKE